MRLTVLSVACRFSTVSEDSVGGAEQILAGLDRALHERGHSSLVVAPEGSRVRGALLSRPRAQRIDTRTRREAHERAAFDIERILRVIRVDVVHVHGADFMEYLPPPGPVLVVTLHQPPSWYPRRAFEITRPRTYYVCASASQREECPPSTVDLRVVPHGVRLDAFTPRERKDDFALVLGRVSPEKGIHLAVEAARMADVDLIIAGEILPSEEHERYFDKRVRPLLDDRRRYVGPVGLGAKSDLLARARCVLVPSLAHETSSLTAMEALASATPVIAFRSGALREMIDHGRTGLLVADVDEMAAAIRHVSLIRGEACRRAAEERFDVRVMCSEYEALYADVTRAARASA